MDRIKYAIFDADGTLMDSMHIWDTAASAFLLMRGIENNEIGVFRRRGFRDGIEYIIEKYNLTISPLEIQKMMIEILRYYYFNVAEKKQGVESFLRQLKADGAKLAVATATDKSFMLPALERNGILKYFDSVLTTQETGRNKHHPDIYNISRDAIGGDETTVIFEDALYAVRTAKEAGYTVVAVEDYSAYDEQEEIKASADYYIRNYSEIYKYFDI